jgi:diguanylate cyclase (GGDEF)-like protein
MTQHASVPHLDLLRQVPLFRDLPEGDLMRLAKVSVEESFVSESVIVAVGEPGHRLYIVLEGEVQVLYPARSQDFELARLKEGDFFGEMALLNDMPRSATVKAVGNVRTLAIEKEDFRRIVRQRPDLAIMLLEMMSVRIRNADEHISGLSEKVMRDPLTGLLNRRAFHERIREEADRSRRYGDSFALILMDLDRFKTVNDTFGHEAGDEVLRWVGRILSEHTRSADAPFRIGGEEFAVLAPATTGVIARSVAERLVRVVAEARPPLDVDLRITSSAGWAASPDHGRNPDALFNVADRALLRAKTDGRNQVCDPELEEVALTEDVEEALGG